MTYLWEPPSCSSNKAEEEEKKAMVLATNKGNDLTYLGNLVLNLTMSVVRESGKSEIW